MSTQTVSEDTITEMNKYNFNKPINVTIIFDECEEDNDCQEVHDTENSTTDTNVKANDKNTNSNTHEKLIHGIKKKLKSSNKKLKNLVNNDGERKSKQNKGLEKTGTIKNPSLIQTHNNHMEYTTMHLVYNPGLNQCNKSNQQINTDMMLGLVANNMILIMEAYTNYYKILNNSVDNLTFEYSDCLRTNYLRIKYYYFNKSQTISELILLPQERNKCFIESFLFRTIQMAKGKMNISYNNLRNLYFDLLEWTKQKQEHSLRAIKENQNRNNVHPLLRVIPPSKSLSQNISDHIRRPESESQTKDFDKINLFSSGPPGNEITISVDPKFINPKTHHVTTQYRPTCLNEMQSINHNVQTSVPLSNIVNCNAKESIGFNNTPIRNIQERRIDTQRILEDPCAKYSSRLPVIYQDNMQSRVTPRSSNEYETSKQSDSQDANRCSISRDSGFMSPIIFNQLSEPTYDVIRDQCLSKTTSMTVSNVTTYMPNTTNSILGLCHVCGKITKIMCVGCYKLYYCSEACQSADWNVHKFVCHK
ncbi:unnamed protein product [Parnassius apollo]|uniref:(apollo) hypothetical protein n=1 Tax=Parnassius apollo TaxID=110799 RepID=A0A8S3WKI3_PARAO|nr:unnamed protein product [Parnassius apollo]